MSSALGLFVLACVCSFSVRTRPAFPVLCYEHRCVGMRDVCWSWLIMSGRVGRDMGQVQFLFHGWCVCVLVWGSRFLWHFWFFMWHWMRLKRLINQSPVLRYNIPLSLKLINLFSPVSVTRVCPEWNFHIHPLPMKWYQCGNCWASFIL